MERWTTTFVGFLAVVLPLWLVVRNFHAPPATGHTPDGGAAETEWEGGAAALALTGPEGGEEAGPLLVSDFVAPNGRVDSGAGAALFDGTAVPSLPLNAPRQVRFGVVLVSYTGAQPSPAAAAGVHSPLRGRTEARTLAQTLLTTAEQDFHAAVQQGDPGSADDVGKVRLGILEPAPEYVLFTLPVAGVGGPVETPRGFWIVKRLE
jgi:hypothetical protein